MEILEKLKNKNELTEKEFNSVVDSIAEKDDFYTPDSFDSYCYDRCFESFETCREVGKTTVYQAAFRLLQEKINYWCT